MSEWIQAVKDEHTHPNAKRTGFFDEDARAYLEAVKAMPTFADRKRHIEEWIAVFLHRPRRSITSDEIAAQLHAWRTTSRPVNYARRGQTATTATTALVLSASAVNHRRTALQHMWTVLDGRAGKNPVRNVPKFREPDPLPRGLPYAAIDKLWKVIGDTPARARLMVLAYIGLPHAQIAQLRPEHCDLAGRAVIVQGRRKGRGTTARLVPLTPQGVRAIGAMFRTKAWGKFHRSWLHKVFRRGCAQVPELAALPNLRPYDLRHSFGSEVYRQSGDIRATQVLMGQSTPQLTHRYTLAAVDQRVAAALKGFGKSGN